MMRKCRLSYSKFCFIWPLPTSSSQFKPKNLMEPQLFLLDVEIKCFHEVGVSDYQCVQWLLSNTSRFVFSHSGTLEVKENRSTEAQIRSGPSGMRNWMHPHDLPIPRDTGEPKAAAHSFSNSESAEKLPLGYKKWVLSVAGTHFRYLTKWEKKVKPTLFLHKRPPFAVMHSWIQQPKVEK